MIAYFVRQSLAAALSWLLAMFLIYSVTIPSAYNLLMNAQCGHCFYSEIVAATEIQQAYALDEVWPVDYLTWVFGSSKDPMLEFHSPDSWLWAAPAIAETYYFERSTVITGNWGKSVFVSEGTSVLDMYGIDLPLFLVLLFVPVALLMLIAVLQRLGRQPVGGTSFQAAKTRYNIEPLRVLG